MRSLFLSLHSALSAIAITSVLLLSATTALAAERVVLKYRFLRQSIAVNELTTFAETGKLSSSLRVNLALARQDPQAVRRYLTAPVTVSPVLLDRVLNSPVGEIILDQVSQTIHTPSGKANRQALRSALILSARSDGEITLIETIQNYPTSEVEVEGDRLESAYNQLRRLESTLEKIPGIPNF